MGAWQGPLANGWHQQPKAVTRRSTANIAQLNQGSPSQTLRQRLRVALCTNGSSQSLPYFHEAYLVAKVIGPTPKPTLIPRAGAGRSTTIGERCPHAGCGSCVDGETRSFNDVGSMSALAHFADSSRTSPEVREMPE